MAIPIQCKCGKNFRVREETAGRKVRCPACNVSIAIPMPEADESADDEALDVQVTENPLRKSSARSRARDEDEDESDQEEPEARVTSKPPPMVRRVDEDDEDEPRSRGSSARRREEEEEEEDEPRPRRKKRDRRDRDEERHSSSGFAISPSIIGGILMMLGAVAWFVLGIILIDRIFFYPPILFFLGIAAIIRGLTGQGD